MPENYRSYFNQDIKEANISTLPPYSNNEQSNPFEQRVNGATDDCDTHKEILSRLCTMINVTFLLDLLDMHHNHMSSCV